jgi:hypothetical protein
VRREERNTVRLVLVLAGTAIFIVVTLPFAMYFFGLAVAPPRPVPAPAAAPQVVLDALWARAEGGGAAELRPMNPVVAAEFVACMIAAAGENDNQRRTHCRHVIPAMPGLEYLSTLHIKDNGMERNSFRGGYGSFATTVWMTRSWTKADFLNTLAARADFGNGWRGIDAAALAVFGRTAAELTLPQAALLASRVGDTHANPWCETEEATAMRNRVLARMRDNGAIDEAAFQAASTAPLGVATPPEGRPPCQG